MNSALAELTAFTQLTIKQAHRWLRLGTLVKIFPPLFTNLLITAGDQN